MSDNEKKKMEEMKDILKGNKHKEPNKTIELLVIYAIVGSVTSRVYSSYQRATVGINLKNYFIV